MSPPPRAPPPPAFVFPSVEDPRTDSIHISTHPPTPTYTNHHHHPKQVGWGRNGNVLDFDLGRTLRNGLIGAIFGPLVHYYYDFSDWILPQEVPVNRIFKIIMDQVWGL